tara:strand:+ start:67781 stop:68797 length:1017 start_codon:yes stop_codon:yes gene_type:complete
VSKALTDIAQSIALYRDEPIPIILVTGFLGAGKTSFIKHYLSLGDAQDSAVVVNEFGEIGLDHLILETVSDDIVLMQNGCLCCSSADDLELTLMSLYERRERASLPRYSRVIIETSGIASPEPILAQLNSDALKLSPYRYQGMITIIDAQTFLNAHQESLEARMQLLYADRVLINKIEGVAANDIADIQALLTVVKGEPGELLAQADNNISHHVELLQPCLQAQPSAPAVDGHNHPEQVFSTSYKTDKPIAVQTLLDFINQRLLSVDHEVLRIKLLTPNPNGSGQLFLQTVRERWFPQQLINAAPDETRLSSLVVIAKQSAKARVEAELADFFHSMAE